MLFEIFTAFFPKNFSLSSVILLKLHPKSIFAIDNYIEKK